MNKLMDYLAGLFRKSESVRSETPFLHETIDLEKFDHISYRNWLDSDHFKLLQKRLSNAYFDFKLHKESLDIGFEFWYQPASKGFIIFNRKEYNLNKEDFVFFQYYIYSLLKDHHYKLNLADIKSRRKADWIETIRKFYLKPSRALRTAKISDQLFGNIHLEYFERDEYPYMLRLLANAYQDQKYHQPKDFDDLMHLITNQ